DEQHRFGVKQRAVLKSFGTPHLLSMTATPIPRTLAITVYGDQDLSIIDEMPAGRQVIITRLVPEGKRKDAYRWIEEQVRKGRQAFVICPLVEESDTLEVKSVTQEYAVLQNEIFPDLKVGLLHGRMKQEEKDNIMQDFKDNKINILTSTSVIEVGIDVPNASIMIIEGCERFGLSQLHQFRGRVGRGVHQSYCFLFTNSKSEGGSKRIKSMEQHSSGFKLAEIDLQLRGPGEVYGVKQSGIPELKVAKLTDFVTIEKARLSAIKIIEADPLLQRNPKLAEKIAEKEEIYVTD
ncbi:DNA helicase RecG, partial [Candidatus Gracilibacteria bacterium]|nr:DNA helicase RecG [Candidatus Gracilibacteria bacterium]